MLESFLAPISAAGLSPIIVDVDYFALENMFELNQMPNAMNTVALIDIGARYSAINIIKDGSSVFTGDVPLGGRNFTDIVAEELGLTESQAETLKITGKGDSRQRAEIEHALSVASGQLFDEIQRSFSFFWTDPGDQIESIYLSGGTARIPGLDSAMSKHLQVPVEVVDPFFSVTINRHANEEFIRQHAASLAVSVGLATRRPGDQ